MSNRSARIVYLLLLAAVLFWSYRNPHYNWDMIPYIAQARMYKEHDFRAIHAEIYAEVRKEVPSDKYDELMGTAGVAANSAVYRSDMARNYLHFAEQLPFYSTKPLYVMCIYALQAAGFGAVQATLIPSLVAYLILALTVFEWVGHFAGGFYRIVCASFIAFNAPVLLLPRLPTPDSLSTALVLLALYFLLERQSAVVCSGLLMLSLYARTNNVVLAGLVIGYLALWAKGSIRLSYLQGGVSLGVCMASVSAINHFSGFYGWATLFHQSLVGLLNTPGESLVHISVRTYLATLRQGLFFSLFNGFLSQFVFLGVVALLVFRATKNNERMLVYRDLTLLVLASLVAYYLLMPSMTRWFEHERFVVPQYLFLAISFVVAMLTRLAQVTRPASA